MHETKLQSIGSICNVTVFRKVIFFFFLTYFTFSEKRFLCKYFYMYVKNRAGLWYLGN